MKLPSLVGISEYDFFKNEVRDESFYQIQDVGEL